MMRKRNTEPVRFIDANAYVGSTKKPDAAGRFAQSNLAEAINLAREKYPVSKEYLQEYKRLESLLKDRKILHLIHQHIKKILRPVTHLGKKKIKTYKGFLKEGSETFDKDFFDTEEDFINLLKEDNIQILSQDAFLKAARKDLPKGSSLNIATYLHSQNTILINIEALIKYAKLENVSIAAVFLHVITHEMMHAVMSNSLKQISLMQTKQKEGAKKQHIINQFNESHAGINSSVEVIDSDGKRLPNKKLAVLINEGFTDYFAFKVMKEIAENKTVISSLNKDEIISFLKKCEKTNDDYAIARKFVSSFMNKLAGCDELPMSKCIEFRARIEAGFVSSLFYGMKLTSPRVRDVFDDLMGKGFTSILLMQADTGKKLYQIGKKAQFSELVSLGKGSRQPPSSQNNKPKYTITISRNSQPVFLAPKKKTPPDENK